MLFSPTVTFVSKRLSRAIKKKAFLKVSYRLSISAYVLATFAIALMTTVLGSLSSYQTQRLLTNSPSLVLNFEQSFAQVGKKSPNTTFIEALPTFAKLKPYTKAVTTYSGGSFFMEGGNTLIEGQVVGVANSNFIAGSNPYPPEVARALAKGSLAPGSYALVLPSYLAYNYRLSPGDQVTLFNGEKSLYLPSGQVPISRTFTILGFYQALPNSSIWYSNLEDVSRLNRERKIHSLAFYLYQPLEIESVSKIIEAEFQLQLSSDYLYSPLPHHTSMDHINMAHSSVDHTSVTATSSEGDKTPSRLSTLSNSTQPLTIVSGSDWRNRLAVVFSSIKLESRVTFTLTSLLVVIALFSCLITLSFIIIEKDRDIAILNVIGMEPRAINKVFLVILLKLILKGNLISLVLFALGYGAWPYYNHYFGLPVPLILDLFSLVKIYCFYSVVIAFFTALTTYFIIKIRPAQVLR